jgi:uncharacterized protein YutE (UPF0331/DUF86 family)
VARRLRLLEETLTSLESLRDIGVERLRAEPLTRAAAERLLQVAVDLAFDINAHLIVAVLGRSPETGRQSFLDLAECRVLGLEEAARLAPAAGLRNVLVHHYVGVRLDVVAEAIGETIDRFPNDVTAVARFIAEDPRLEGG